MGAGDDSLIVASERKRRHERQLRRTLPRNRAGDFRSQARRIPTEGAERVIDASVTRYDHVHDEVPAVRRRRHVVNEQIVQAIVGMSICQRKVQGPLNLSAELPCFSIGLPA